MTQNNTTFNCLLCMLCLKAQAPICALLDLPSKPADTASLLCAPQPSNHTNSLANPSSLAFLRNLLTPPACPSAEPHKLVHASNMLAHGL